MKYLLVQNSDGSDPRVVTICDTKEDRIRETRAAILGPCLEGNKDQPCPELEELAERGIVHFEGDPSLEWIDAEVVDCTRSFTGQQTVIRVGEPESLQPVIRRLQQPWSHGPQ